jgi:hypothetical protein
LATAAVSVTVAAAVAPWSASAAGNAGGNVSESWSIPNVPAAGLSNITFPMTVNPATLRAAGTYFAQQFNFTNAPEVGYTGLQPRSDLNGHQRLHAAFSSFNAGTTSTDSHCSNGADGGAGVSCAADFDGVYGHPYAITVTRTATDTWTGTAIDTVTGIANHIGTYTLPTGSGNIRGSQGGFVEYYLGSPSCDQLPKIDVVFGAPTTTDAGGLTGKAQANYEYSGCIGTSGYTAVNTATDTHVTRGFISNSDTPTPTPTPTPSGTGWELVSAASQRCLDDPGSSTTNGTQTIIWDCHGGSNQQWTSTTAGTLVNGTGKCLDAQATAAGSKVDIWDCNGSAGQKWKINTDGTVTGTASGLCLDVTGGATANGTLVELWSCTGASNQKWARN